VTVRESVTRKRRAKPVKKVTQHIQIGKKTQELLNNPDYSDWSNDELIRGQNYDRNGRFTGQPPKVIPLALLHELNKRMSTHAIKDLNAALEPAVKYLSDVASGVEGVEVDVVRVRVCEGILNRILGMNPQRVELQTIEKSVWEKEGVTKAIVVRDVIDVNSEEWENPFEDNE